MTQCAGFDPSNATPSITASPQCIPLVKNITGGIDLKLLKTKPFECRVIILYYQPFHVST